MTYTTTSSILDKNHSKKFTPTDINQAYSKHIIINIDNTLSKSSI